MSPEEKQVLQTAISTMADPRGNWDYGWKLLCELAELDPKQMTPHFKTPEVTELPPALGEVGGNKSIEFPTG
jgi:hypothetical protein